MSGLEQPRFTRAITVAAYGSAVAVVLVLFLDTGSAEHEVGPAGLVFGILAAVAAGVLGVVSLTSIGCYFVFMPSISEDGHLFARVHETHLVHPLTSAVVMGLLAACVFCGSLWGWLVWCVLLALYLVQTWFVVGWVRAEQVAEGAGQRSMLWDLLHLIVGGELVTVASGAKPLAPWRLSSLPEDTWVVDVRTKAEFCWNRLQAAENYPWGAGVADAAAGRSKDLPVLVTCLSGHRSPAVALILRKLGFKAVYNLNWGLLYLIILDRCNKGTGPFNLTRANRDPNRRGPDAKGISVGYIAFALITLVAAPVENGIAGRSVSVFQALLGAVMGLGGLGLGIWSFKALGRNFRVFAAPRRSGTIITEGIYSKVRHPMYTGVVMGLAGYVVCWGGLYSLIPWALCSGLYLVKSIKEEQILAQRFPEYEEYRKRTWKFVPYVY